MPERSPSRRKPRPRKTSPARRRPIRYASPKQNRLRRSPPRQDNPRQKTPRQALTRRQFLAWLGMGGATLTAGGGIVWVLIHLLARRASDRLLAAIATEAAITAQAPTLPVVPRPPIVAREAWGALPPDHTAANENGFYDPASNPEGWRAYTPPLIGIYNTVIIHHAAFYQFDDLSTVREIDRLHRDDRGWADIAYHYLIGLGGTIYEGRPLNVRGTHTAGYNTGTVGICFLGNFVTDYPSEAAIRATLALVQWLAAELSLTHLAGHIDFNPTTECPGTNLIPYLDVLASASGLVHGTQGYRPSPEQLTPAPEN
jgi:hypothetical protein